MKTMLITGATSGIGLALTKLALNYDFHVIACGRTITPLSQLNSQQLTIKQFDVTDKKATCNALHDCQPDIVVLNAGTCIYVDMDTFSSDAFHQNFNVNFFGAIYVIEALLPRLQTNTQLVFVDSLARLLPFTRASAYGSSKSALHYMANSLRTDLPELVVQTVSPGFVDTPLTQKNAFEMPMLVTPEIAAQKLLKGILQRKRHITFPKTFALILSCLSLLPTSWQTHLTRKMK